MAQQAGLARSTTSSIINSKQVVDYETAEKLSTVLQCPIPVLFDYVVSSGKTATLAPIERAEPDSPLGIAMEENKDEFTDDQPTPIRPGVPLGSEENHGN